MKNNLLLIAACLLLSACEQPIVYVGDRLAKTNKVDVFYTAPTSKNYKVIGHLESHYYKLAVARGYFIREAKKVGADAIIILNADTNSTARIKRLNSDVLKYN